MESTIYDRDRWTCQLCGVVIARDRSFPHPLSGTLDHIVPRRSGGTDEVDNLRAAHLRCNASRGAPDDSSVLLPDESPGNLGFTLVEAPDWLIELMDIPSPDPLPFPPQAPLDPDSVGLLYDDALGAVTSAITDGFAANDEMAGLWDDCLSENDGDRDHAEMEFQEVLEEAVRLKVLPQIASALADQMPDTAGLAPFLRASGVGQPGDWIEVAAQFSVLAGIDTILDDALDRAKAEHGDPGYFDGAHWEEWLSTATDLKAEGRLEEAAALLMRTIDAAEAESDLESDPTLRRWVPSDPYHQAAIVARKMGERDAEVAVLTRFNDRRQDDNHRLAKRLKRLLG